VTAEAAAGDAVRVERLTVRYGEAVACANVSFSVQRGAVYALLGRAGAGKTTIVRCLLGRQEADSGRVLVLGEDAHRKRRRLASRIATSPGELREKSELLLLDDPEEVLEPPDDSSSSSSRSALIATDAPEKIAGVATHFGILKQGRLVIDAPIGALDTDIRRIRYVNRMTETRTNFGTELDEFHAHRVQVRGWGIEAIVSGFDPPAFERFSALDGVEEAAADFLTLQETFQALA
jgi:ABC-type multidrug transport system ATPase subunit